MLKIVNIPNSVLSEPTKSVEKIDDSVRKLVFDMEKTLVAQKDPQGVGLAANQVGLSLSLFVIKKSPKAEAKVFINPKILKLVNPLTRKPGSKKNKKPVKLEGCLSIPRIWGPVRRANKIFLEYQDLTGKVRKEWFTGFEATIIQHEIDHLNGIVFTQRVLEQKHRLYKEVDGDLKPIEI